MTTTDFEKDPVREFLESAKEAKLEIARHRERVEELESRCTRMTANMSATPGGGNSDTQQLWATLAEERDKELAAEKRELEKYHAVESFINRVPDERFRAILRLRYLNVLGWIRVQMKLYESGIFYSESHIKKLHGMALESARELWRKEHGEDAIHT